MVQIAFGHPLATPWRSFRAGRILTVLELELVLELEAVDKP
jgi:hypothetical protein